MIARICVRVYGVHACVLAESPYADRYRRRYVRYAPTAQRAAAKGVHAC
eukprot:SAG22_NODE_20151_length_268_cov_0.609467_1_plen_48_part_01